MTGKASALSPLSNSFIDLKLSVKAQIVLKALNANQIYGLMLLWLSSPTTKPQINWEDLYPASMSEIPKTVYERTIEEIRDEIGEISKAKRLLLQKISADLWPRGLNLLQVAHVQCKSLLEYNRDTHLWGYSTLFCGKDEFIPAIDPRTFVKSLNNALYPMVIGHLYTTTHDTLSLVIVRVQILEPKLGVSSGAFLPVKPIYIAFPISSPHILHTFGDNVYLKAIFHSLKSILSQAGKPVTIKKSTSLPSRNLETFATIKGVSRHAAALGPWSIYADGVVDDSPLNPFTTSDSKRPSLEPTNDKMEKRIRLANVKYTGRPDGGPNKEQQENGKLYQSKFPVSMSELKICEPFDNRLDRPEITIRLEGTDVFAGLYHLAVHGDSELNNLPTWLTGEDGETSGIIRGGIIQSDS